MRTRSAANAQCLAGCCALMLAGAGIGASPAEVAGLLEANRHQQAVTASNVYLEKHPADARMRFLRAVALAETDRTDEAAALFKQVAEAHSDWPEPANNLAVLHARRGDYEAARRWLERALNTRPAYATAHDNLGDVYAALAAAAYREALDDGEQPGRAPVNLALVPNLSGIRVSDTAVAAAETQPGDRPDSGAKQADTTGSGTPDQTEVAVADTESTDTSTAEGSDTPAEPANKSPREPQTAPGSAAPETDQPDSPATSEKSVQSVSASDIAGGQAEQQAGDDESAEPAPESPAAQDDAADNTTDPEAGEAEAPEQPDVAMPDTEAPDETASANADTQTAAVPDASDDSDEEREADGEQTPESKQQTVPPAREEADRTPVAKDESIRTASAQEQSSAERQADAGDPADAGTTRIERFPTPSGQNPSVSSTPQSSKGGETTVQPSGATEVASPEPDQPAADAVSDEQTNDKAARRAAARALVARWRAAWSEQDVSAYLDLYAYNFQPDDRTLEQWRTWRREQVRKPESVTVEVRDIEVHSLAENRLRVSFVQTYHSDDYSDRVHKTLILSRPEGNWRILRETSRPY